jgi:hypothetical protein
VVIDIIYAETETAVVKTLQEKWKRHDADDGTHGRDHRSVRPELGARATAARNDRSASSARRSGASTSPRSTTTASKRRQHGELERRSDPDLDPFGTQYEYTPSYNDFGHTDDDEHFFQQMEFLSPELLRVLKPGRIMAIHVKDRIRPGGLEGLGFQTVSPFHAECILHYRRQGFAYMGMITVVTDVVRENNQTYRLGWTSSARTAPHGCRDARVRAPLPETAHRFNRRVR